MTAPCSLCGSTSHGDRVCASEESRLQARVEELEAQRDEALWHLDRVPASEGVLPHMWKLRVDGARAVLRSVRRAGS